MELFFLLNWILLLIISHFLTEKTETIPEKFLIRPVSHKTYTKLTMHFEGREKLLTRLFRLLPAFQL
ncbi:hypothetical protein D1164_21085 [Mariniphaga sediminis]|uniref:Uncharacterized protein n=1 Tax=Mariniphaga sediminis TaxID=1628158 RepID=A0A399CYS5_9BACT|nr:hypothetical protein D1164_21085 [Mariniphaga sediminis]